MSNRDFKNYVLRLKLLSFIGSKIVEIENDEGFMEKGVFIPLDINGLHVTDRGNVSLYAFVTERLAAAKNGTSHYLRMKISREALQKLYDLGYENPYIGEMKPSFSTPKYQIDYFSRIERVKTGNNLTIDNKEEIDYGGEL